MKNRIQKTVDLVSDYEWGLRKNISTINDIHAYGELLESTGKILKSITKEEFDEEYGR